MLDRLRVAGRLKSYEGELRRGDGAAFPALLTLRLHGVGSRNLLSRGCGLNFSESAFPPGHCSKTRFAHLPLLIHRPEQSGCFELYIDRSHAGALWAWLVSQ